MNIAIIPARGGSKRIPRKNIRDFCGRPIIAYAIERAKKSGVFSKVMVSTDDQEIFDVSKNLGAEVLPLRPSELSDDHTPLVPVIQHAIHSLEESGFCLQNVCCIYPCVPLLLSEDLCNSLKLMTDLDAESCIPVCEFLSAPQRAFRVSDDSKISWVNPSFKLTRTQDLEKFYYHVGAFDWASRDKWMTGDLADGVAYIMANNRVVDIDTSEDWSRAELLYRMLQL